MAYNDIFAGNTNPYIQAAQATSAGNQANAQAATAANRVNQATPYANLSYQQTGTDAYGNPVWSATQSLAQPFQQTLGNIQGQLQQATANPFDVSQFQAGKVGQGPQFQGVGQAPNLQTQVQGTGMEGWDKATGLLMSRLNPQIQQGQERLQAQLANQGIVPGTEAYNRAMTQQGQKENDLLTQAQLAGSNVQNQMFGQNLQAGQFTNQALTGQNALNLGNTQFNNQLGQQGFANQMAATQANNAANQQNYQQALAARNLPLQQLGAFREATQPGYVNPYAQAAVSGPEYLTAYNASRAADIAQQNAQLARQSATTSGLYGLGGALLQGSGGLGGLGSLASAGLSGLSNLGNWFNSQGFGNSGLTSGLVNNGFTGNNYDDFGNLISSGNAAPGAADWATSFNQLDWR